MNVEVKPTAGLGVHAGRASADRPGGGRRCRADGQTASPNVCALAGLQVNLLDAKADALDKGHGDDGSQHGPPGPPSLISPDDKIEALGRIKLGTDYAMFDEPPTW